MVLTRCACVLLALSVFATEGKSSETCAEKERLSLAMPPRKALLQARHTMNSNASEPLIADAEAEVDHKASVVEKKRSTSQGLMKLNPSGAAAPLTSEGYLAVADRCCQAEMKQFIERQVLNLGLQICEDPGGLAGIVHYHTCPFGPQTFDKLTADLLADSLPRCRWLAPQSETCTKPFPEDCETFEGVIPADCGCSRSAAAKLDFASATIATNNLAGLGPSSGPSELRYSSGLSSSGQGFDLVVTAAAGYSGFTNTNGILGGFGKINIKVNTSANFLFSIMEIGTNTPLELKEIHMATFDLDGSHKWGLEAVSSKGYHGYVTDRNPNIEASLFPDGRVKFTGDATGAITNPVDPNTLTRQQRRNSVMYFYKNTSSFELSFSAIHSEPFTDVGGRMIFFAFESALDDRCGP